MIFKIWSNKCWNSWHGKVMELSW